MLFTFRSAMLVGLVALSFASPLPEPESVAEGQTLVARAKIPSEVNCDGKKFSSDDIKAALKESHTQHGSYPHEFGNNKKGKNPKRVFSNIPDSTQLHEYPLTNPVWKSGEPGKYRVVMKDDYSYVGTMIEGAGSSFKKC